ncbi:glycoside hydrolase family 5 protein [Sanghuangporus baumii]|uniref:Glycoside hydrolase family 5 protein n=1 Tax=Sanghuangporus baumii TaxID=108892 RepID=A0A9Q5HXA2_SANBA|nr:glycoside hydrolase family 5 protein [Sanghuangporus baumii]
MSLALKGLCTLLLWFLASILPKALAGFPNKIYGVNLGEWHIHTTALVLSYLLVILLGSWLVLEPWMLPEGWLKMGGQSCDNCADCIDSEFAFAQAYPDTVDEIFDKHWSTWFTQDDVNKLASYGINTVRIPLGYWIVEPLVNRRTEFYPRGGIKQLKRGLKQLKGAGIKAILDHHALPGIQTPGQQFTGRCTTDVEFYTDYNYHRALVWTAVMTAVGHLDPDFGSVVAIEAVNEPIMDASQTPRYGDFQKNFVKVVRAVETLLDVENLDSTAPEGLLESLLGNTLNVTQSLLGGQSYGGTLGKVLTDAAPIFVQVASELGIGSILTGGLPSRTPLVTMFMDINWQFNDPSNPADAARGPQVYDNHLYYSFGGVADANEEAYLTSICNLQRVQADSALQNSPLVFGEWSLATEFDPSDQFLAQWADAQKRAYSIGAGWMFWSFKTEISSASGDTPRFWSYYEAIERGYMTKDPSEFNDPHVCDAYITNSTSSTV